MSKKENIKKNENIVEKENESFLGDIWGKLFVIFGVISFFCCFYLLTVYITNKDKDKTDTSQKDEVTISTNEILLGRTLNVSDGDYYVIYYDQTVEDIKNVYDPLVNDYRNKGEKIYFVDMGNSFNKKYSTDGESNKNPTKISEFKINGPTLMKISNKKVVEYIEGEDAIRTNLN